MTAKFLTKSILYSLVFSVTAGSFILIRNQPILLAAIIPAFWLFDLFAVFFSLKTDKRRIKVSYHGAILLTAFCISVVLSVIYHAVLAFYTIPHDYMSLVWSGLYAVLVNALVFWTGIICVYLCSNQLGLRLRVIGIVCSMIPIANLIALYFIIRTTVKEAEFEIGKDKQNELRKDQRLCATRYPILLVHGVFFRDFKYFNYWGRIPKELEVNGASVYYGNHQSARPVADSALEIAQRIKEILKETGAEKVNIIAHSKGGLDCRCAIASTDIAPYVASLTTVNTPHRGCLFADYLLKHISSSVKDKVASTYNSALKKLGDKDPDFLAAVNDLTASSCKKFNETTGAPPDHIFCQSVGSVLKKASGGKFPLNFSYLLVKLFDGANDGLVSASSFEWGEKYTLLEPRHKEGISHGDIIDLNRINLPDFDVREFYVTLVNDLKNRGY